VKPIVIVGGGLAGLTLGIGLRERGVPVTIFEAGQYPRHRVCGEFISGQGQQVLVHLGLEEKLRQAGLRPATNVRFYLDPAPEVEQTLPQPGWCLSRHILDELLAREFQRLGGELHERERWSEPMCGEGIVRASGRRVQPLVEGWRFFALKAHVRGVELAADLEMHFVPSGYVGICRLAGDAPAGEVRHAREAVGPHLIHMLQTVRNGIVESTKHARSRGVECRPQVVFELAVCVRDCLQVHAQRPVQKVGA